LLSASAPDSASARPGGAGGPEGGANTLGPVDALDWQPDVDGQADTAADRHLQRLEPARRVDSHGINSAW
jgi:hypothetical protein